jgi:hypothetical protein
VVSKELKYVLAAIALGIAAGAFLGCGLPLALLWWAELPYRFQSLTFGDGLRIDITAKPSFDTTPGLTYEVRRGGRVVHGPLFFGSLHPWKGEERFAGLELRGGSLVAVYEVKRPHFLLIVFDAESGEAWPCDHDFSIEEDLRLHNLLLDRVREVSGDRRFRLGCYDSSGLEPME